MRKYLLSILSLSVVLWLFIPQDADAQFRWNKKKKKKEKTELVQKNDNTAVVISDEKAKTSEISVPDTIVVEETVADTEPLQEHWDDGVITATVILPFNLDAATTEAKRQQMRVAEFYQGFLLAVNETQRTGRQIKVQTYDCGTQNLRDILERPEISYSDFIIAPMDDQQVREVADYGEGLGIPVISVFAFDPALLDSAHSHLFQVNAHKSMMYDALSDDLMSRFQNHTVVFVKDEGASKEDPYPANLRNKLKDNGHKFLDFSYSNPEMLMKCDSILNLENEDMLIVPVTPDRESMRKMFSGLLHVKISRDTLEVVPQIAILGYPEWALSTSEFIDYYYDLNVYMFSKIYINPFDLDVKQFYYQFKQWYHKDLMPLIPKYGVLGYDVATYFMTAVIKDGGRLEQNVRGYKGETLQTAMCFSSGPDGGFYNSGLYLVHFTPESTIEKIVIE